MSDLRIKMMDQLACPICHLLFTTPKQLNCLHRFCENCLHKYIMSHTHDHIEGVFCPACRQLSQVKNYTRGLDRRYWAQQYPTDFETESLCDILRGDCETCTEHDGKQVLGYCQGCRSCLCEDCDHDCVGFIPVRAEVKRRKADLQNRLEPLRKKSKNIREHLKVVKTEKEELDNNYTSTLDKIHDEFNSIRKMIAEEEENLSSYLHDVQEVGHRQLGTIEQEMKKRLRLISTTEKELSNAVSTKSGVRFIEKTRKNFEEFDDCDVDKAINPGSYSQLTKFNVKKARIDKIRKHVKRIVPDCQSSTKLEKSDADSDTDLVISPPPTPCNQDNYFPNSLSTCASSPTSPIANIMTPGNWFHQ